MHGLVRDAYKILIRKPEVERSLGRMDVGEMVWEV
jgi:hypothetical protein